MSTERATKTGNVHVNIGIAVCITISSLTKLVRASVLLHIEKYSENGFFVVGYV
jgi:hypothetical protein